MHRLVVREYGCIVSGTPKQIGKDLINVCAEDFAYLKTAITSEESDDMGELLKLCTKHGHEALQVQNFAGIIQTPRGTIIEILPKVYAASKEDDEEAHARRILLTMLRHFRALPFKQSDTALLAQGKIPLMEFFIGHFLGQMTRLIKYGIRSDYVVVEDNLTYLKGKLNLTAHIRKNVAHKEHFHVRFDEFLPNRPENRLIKSSLLLVASLTRTTANQKLCREHLFTFNDIPPSTNHACDFHCYRSDRNMAHYDEVMMWCRMLLGGNSPLPQFGKRQCISLLFPMEKLFEDYVAAKLKRQQPNWQISTQTSTEHLIQNHKRRKLFKLKPDILIREEGRQVVADTKWKLISTIKSGYGISQSDLYQVYAYGHKYLSSQDTKEVILIYPMTGEFMRPLDPFAFENGFILRVLPFDIEAGHLQLN
ncbi:MAG: McrC family protein [Proteobacteria bacterium]|nr:McrC family protein [Pseudomonadota bacterium]